MLVVVNENANAGRGLERWSAVDRVLRERGVMFEARVTKSPAEAHTAAREALRVGRDLVAAGGDGTVNEMVNVLLDPETDLPRGEAALGAVGLGSSNDFHKPFAPERTIADVSVRLAHDRMSVVDVGKAVLHLPDGSKRIRFFVLNASLGLVADGNAFFNTDDRVLRWLKRRHVETAILYTAFVNLLRFRPVRVSIGLDDGPAMELPVSSLGVLKRVHFAGGMRYDTPVTADDGAFDVNVWERMGRVGMIRTMANLYRGRFRGRHRTRSMRARCVRVEPERPVHFELDGETTLIERAELRVIPRVLKVLG